MVGILLVPAQVEVEEEIADLAALEEAVDSIVAPSRQSHLMEVHQRVEADMSSLAALDEAVDSIVDPSRQSHLMEVRLWGEADMSSLAEVLEAWLEAHRQMAQMAAVGSIAVVRSWLLIYLDNDLNGFAQERRRA
jgi:hypothetical protein